MSAMDGLHRLRSRVFFRACDAVLTAALPGLSLSAGSNYERVRSAVGAAARVLPGAADRVRRALSRPGQLPFAPGEIKLIAFGAATTVYRFRPGGGAPELALKIVRKSLGTPLDHAARIAVELRGRYRILAEHYADGALVVPAQFLVLQGPLLGRAAAACVQPYRSGRDFFDIAEEEIASLLHASAPLMGQFRVLVERTLAMAAAERRCIDLVGVENLLLVDEEDGARLQLLDFGLHDFDVLRAKAPPLLAQTRARLELLRRTYRTLLGAAAADRLPLSTGI